MNQGGAVQYRAVPLRVLLRVGSPAWQGHVSITMQHPGRAVRQARFQALGAVQCCAVLCAVLCCAVLGAVQCCAVLCSAVQCGVLYCAVLGARRWELCSAKMNAEVRRLRK